MKIYIAYRGLPQWLTLVATIDNLKYFPAFKQSEEKNDRELAIGSL